MAGFFLTFESIDGLGKTTQVKRLVESLTALGYDLYVTKEPGDRNAGSDVGHGVRALVFKDPTTLRMRPGVADLLFLADHIQNAGDIAEEVALGKTVVSDRYADSQWAYNASTSKKCPEWVMKLFGQHYGIVPDLTLLLVARGPAMEKWPITTGRFSSDGINEAPEDISWALRRGKARQGDEAGKQEGKAWNNVEDQRRIQNAYLKALKNEPRTFCIDVWEGSTKEELAQSILSVVLNRLNELTVSTVPEAA